MNFGDSNKTYQAPDSPPKLQRGYLQVISMNDGTNGQRNTNSFKKKFIIDQENYNISNIPNQNHSLKYGLNYTKNTTKASQISLITKERRCTFNTLPKELHMIILQYLQAYEILKNIQSLNKYFQNISTDCKLWKSLNNIQKLNVNLKYLKKSCVVERRSKGKLFKGVSRIDNKPVIIRKINICIANAGHDDGVPTSILREISYLSSINHNNISNIIEVELIKDTAQICSEYYDYNMKEYMKTFTKPKNEFSYLHLNNKIHQPLPEYRMPLRNIKIIAYQILKGLSYLHNQGIMHRNLKSDNILINKSDEVKICDFALSRLAIIPHIQYTPEDPKDRERSGREARRLWYRAPELLLRKTNYAFEIDIWAFGCLLAELALNEPLFSGDSEIEQLFRIFRFVGSPNLSNWSTLTDSTEFRPIFPNWESIYFPYISYPAQSYEYKFISGKMNPNRECAFKKLKLLNEVIGPDGLDLLWNCLSLNPQMRSTADTLLKHKFFDYMEIEPMFSKKDLYSCEKMDEVLPSSTNGYTLPVMSEYQLLSVHEIMKKRQKELKPTDYLPNQLNIQENMRSVLVDWLIDVSVHFEILDETLHFCVNYIDRTLSKLPIEKSKLQLIGVTCMKLADVFNEKSKEYYKQENANEYAYITADEYTPQQLIEMEKIILNLLEFKLNSPTSIHFVKLYCSYLNMSEKVSVIAKFLCDLMLLNYPMMKIDYSLLASIAIFVSCKVNEITPDINIIKKAKKYLAHYSRSEFEQGVQIFLAQWKVIKTTTSYANFEAVYNKYQKIYQIAAKAINIPVITISDAQQWFYLDN